MNQLSDRLNRLSPSATLAMSQKSSELKAQGVDVINLSVGEPDFNTPDHIKAAAVKAVEENYSRYSPVPGYPALREAISAKLKNENGLDYAPAQILCSNGAKQSVCNAIMALVNAGDEVIIPAPYWVSYPQMVKLAEGEPVIVEAGIEQDFKITPEQLEAAITPKTRALILCSPSNPTGSVYSKEELAGLARILAQHERVIVIADEIYEHINYIGKHESIAQFAEIKDRVVIVNGVSKAYAMTGWRIGFIAAPEWIVKGCNKLQGQYTSGPCSVSQKAAEAAYTGSQQCVEDMRQAFERRKNLIVKLAKEIPGLEVNNPEPLREHDGQVRFRKAVFAADKQAGHEKFHVVGKRKMNLCQKQQMMKFFVFQKKPFVFGPADKPVGHLNCGICSRTSHFQFPSPLTEYKYKTLI